MSVVVLAPEKRAVLIREKLSVMLPLPILLGRDVKDFSAVKYAIIWHQEKGAIQPFKALELICSFGAGVDHLLADPDLPKGVPLVRIGDAGLAAGMSRYVLAALGYWEQNLLSYHQQKSLKKWAPLHVRDRPLTGIFGLGTIGQQVAKDLVANGYSIRGFSNSPKQVSGVSTYEGPAQLKSFLTGLQCLVCLLPLTKNTEGMVDQAVFSQMASDSFLINAARGGVLNEADMLAALDNGKLSAAFLDVFNQEPLPNGHVFWEHSKITITPHVASITDLIPACKQIAENIQRKMAGLPLLFEVDKEKGY